MRRLLVALASGEPEDVECRACGATVVDFRDLGEVHP
jgi:hypothetical protein